MTQLDIVCHETKPSVQGMDCIEFPIQYRPLLRIQAYSPYTNGKTLLMKTACMSSDEENSS